MLLLSFPRVRVLKPAGRCAQVSDVKKVKFGEMSFVLMCVLDRSQFPAHASEDSDVASRRRRSGHASQPAPEKLPAV